jgi:hypothetical protein
MYDNLIIEYNNYNYNFYSYLTEHYKIKYTNFLDLENIHTLLISNELTFENKNYYKEIPIFGKTDRNSVFVNDFYNFIDTDYTFLYEYIHFIKNVIKPLFSLEDKLVIQKTPNIRFHLPGCSNIGKRATDKYDDIIGLHYDGEFGHPEEEINIVLPITDMFDSNSIYYEEYPNSNMDVYNYSCMNLKKNNFFMGYLNKCKHYNKINNTEQTRVSLDFRIIPYSKFKNSINTSATSNIKFDIGNYYIMI